MHTIIVAYCKENRVIGNDGCLPWSIPEDLAHFKAATTGCTVIMGNNTFKSIGKCLPNRRNIIVSHSQTGEHPEYVTAEQIKDLPHGFIIGGEQIYRYALENNMVSKVIASEVHRTYSGDTYFPELKGNWTRTLIKEYDEFDLIEYVHQ